MMMVNGFSPDSDWSDAWEAARIKRLQRVSEASAMAMSLSAAIRVNLAGGSMEDVIRPLYTEDEWEVIERAMAEAREREAELRQYQAIMRIASRWRSNRAWTSR